MKAKSKRCRGVRGAGWLLALCCLPLCVQAGVVAPLYVGNVEPVRDEYGRLMTGSHLPSGSSERSLVEIRTSTDGIIRPPATNGAPHPWNPLLFPGSTGGMGMNTASPDSGVFCMVLSNRPAPGTKLFVRAYNAPTREEASFYADSPMAEVPAHESSVAVVFGAAQPLDDADDDGDGLNNSWERSMGTADRPTADYDEDGMSDLHEMLAGTLATDSDSLLAFRTIRDENQAVPGRTVRVRWQSVPGKKYQLQYVMDLSGEQTFIDVDGVVTAGDEEYEMEQDVDVSERAVSGTFRVLLVTEE